VNKLHAAEGSIPNLSLFVIPHFFLITYITFVEIAIVYLIERLVYTHLNRIFLLKILLLTYSETLAAGGSIPNLSLFVIPYFIC